MTDIDCGRLIISQDRDWLRRLWALLGCWRRRSQGRADLARFDERDLRDIGVSPADAYFEVNKPFWRA
jgi:uncharacterized protein YjiS (DUF1127 family)